MLPDDANHPDEFPPDLKPFEASLGALVPAASRVDRDRLMYQAGAAGATATSSQRASGLPRVFWPCATAAMLLIALGMGTVIAMRQPQERIVYVVRPGAMSPLVAGQPILPEIETSADANWPDNGYLVLRERLLRLGVEALDEPPQGRTPANLEDLRNRDLLKQRLGT